MRLRDRTVWLIGASSGIGAALAPPLVAEGARLIISSRRADELEKVADAAAKRGPRPIVCAVDVTDKEALEGAYRELVASLGQIDVLFYNAGTWSQARVEVFDTDSAIGQIDVLYLGLVRAVGMVLPDMISRRGGEIVGMASVAGFAGLPTASAYSSAKSAVNAFLQSIRIELDRYGVGVTTVNPGFVKTPLTDRNEFPMPFMLTPQDAADRIIDGLKAGDEEIHFPRRLSWPAKLLTALPRPIYERLARKYMRRRR